MSDKIKPSEVSQVLLEQLKGISNGEQFDEVAACRGSYGMMKEDEFINEFMKEL